MWSVDATVLGVRRELILCADNADGVVGTGDHALSRADEADLLRVLHGAGLRVPEVVGSGDAQSPLGCAYLVMERGRGTALVGPLRRDPWYVENRDALGADLANLLASIHGAPVPEAMVAACQTTAPAHRAVDLVTEQLRRTPSAQTEINRRAIEWLNEHMPRRPKRLSLVHGDFRTGNVLHGHGEVGQRDGLRLVLDWEMAHAGDPLEDVAWAQLVCWRAGTGRVGSLVAPDTWLTLYESARGEQIDRETVRWWEMVGSVKMSCLLRSAVNVVESVAESRLLDDLFDELGAVLTDLLYPTLAGAPS
ncbi:MAG TPA: phosphotransferase family protein [Mycobacteriales bacterium]|nr:phosphotransferase family protein [Mycobacteriales bacterium]